MGHIRIFKMKFGLVLFMLFAAAASASKVIHLTDCQEPSPCQGLRSHFQFPPQKASSSNQSTSNQSQSHAVNLSSQPVSKKSPNKNSLMPSPNANNFRMSNLLIREINNQHCKKRKKKKKKS